MVFVCCLLVDPHSARITVVLYNMCAVLFRLLYCVPFAPWRCCHVVRGRTMSQPFFATVSVWLLCGLTYLRDRQVTCVLCFPGETDNSRQSGLPLPLQSNGIGATAPNDALQRSTRIRSGYTKCHMQYAIVDVENGKSVRQAAYDHGIPLRSLYHKLKVLSVFPKRCV